MAALGDDLPRAATHASLKQCFDKNALSASTSTSMESKVTRHSYLHSYLVLALHTAIARKKTRRGSLKQKCRCKTSQIKSKGSKWITRRDGRWTMSPLADYFHSAHRHERALWSMNLCLTRSPNPLAVGKWCDGNCALQRNAWSTVPAREGGRWGPSSFPEPLRKP